MKEYKINLKLCSNTLIGSGEGFGAIIDSDIVFDDSGIPFIPSKRIKGCLRSSAKEVIEMLQEANVSYFSNSNIVTDIFGIPGMAESAPVYFSNLFVSDYETNKQWLEYLRQNYPNVISKDTIVEEFTSLRRQTTIEDGVAKAHSLRTIRVLKKDFEFEGNIQIENNDPEFKTLLVLACANLKHIGTKRTRGLGEVKCELNGPMLNSILDSIKKFQGAA
ncbi:MAG: hypothetical protein KKA84_06750 [Bacteroidetes bacterium]|nr:hypothetical protein [Bacteroidota bacterium]